MRKTMILARREYLSAVKRKGFIIGLVLMPLFMSSGFIAIKLSQKMTDATDKRIAVIDRSGLMTDVIVQAAKARNEKEIFDKTGKKVRPAYCIEMVAPDSADPSGQLLALSNRVRAKDLNAFVEIGANILHPSLPGGGGISYYAENPLMDDARQWFSWPVNNRLRALRLKEAGIDEAKVKDLFNWANVNALELVSPQKSGGGGGGPRKSNAQRALMVPMFMVIFMFLLIQMGANPLISTVIEEKTQRIAEVMLGSLTPFEFMMGKVIGGVGVALTAALVYIAGGITMLKYMGMSAVIPWHLVPWFFSFMILAVFMFGSMFAAIGSACSDIKDVQGLVFPAMLLVIIPMMLLMPVLREPLSAFSTWVSLFPPFTPTLMMLRLGSPSTIPAWQPYAGMAGVAITTFLAIWAGGRIFRIGILMQGKPPKLAELVRWALRG